MKAAIYPGNGQPITIETLPDPQPGSDDVIIKVHRCGICGTDLSFTKGGMFDFGTDSQFGHEYAGEVVSLGKNVSELRIGDKISLLPSNFCGHCVGCAGGNNVLCTNPESLMHGFAELARVPVASAVKLPATLSMADGALIEPLAVGLYGLRHSSIKPGDNVLILGGGTVALYAIYWARRLGAHRIVAMSRSDRRQAMVLEMGADAFVPFGDNELGEVIEALGGPPDIVYECVGAEGMLGKAIQHVRPYGEVVSLGFCTSPDPIIPGVASYKCATVKFLVGYSMREFLYIADQMDKGHVDPKAIITNDIPLLDLPKMIDALRGPNEETKVHVCM
jgi:threonine dehydrogenase-like Zn-dependent dehydrogenase